MVCMLISFILLQFFFSRSSLLQQTDTKVLHSDFIPPCGNVQHFISNFKRKKRISRRKKLLFIRLKYRYIKCGGESSTHREPEWFGYKNIFITCIEKNARRLAAHKMRSYARKALTHSVAFSSMCRSLEQSR